LKQGRPKFQMSQSDIMCSLFFKVTVLKIFRIKIHLPMIPEFFVTSVYKLFLYIESFLRISIKLKYMINLSFPKHFTHFVSNTVASEKDLKYHEQLSRFY